MVDKKEKSWKNKVMIVYINTQGVEPSEVSTYVNKVIDNIHDTDLYKQGELQLFAIPVRDRETEVIFWNLEDL